MVIQLRRVTVYLRGDGGRFGGDGKKSNYQNAWESQFSVGVGVNCWFEVDVFDRRKMRNNFKF
jgi:hypothetical protein